MIRIKQFSKTLLAKMLVAVLTVSALPMGVLAEEETPTTYELEASLSCYVTAMGGIDFGDGMVTGVTLTVDESGDVYMTVPFGTSSGKIYGISFVGYVDTEKTHGYYDSNGDVHFAECTTSAEKVKINSFPSKSVYYVDSMTFPVTEASETYYLWLYIGSYTMSKQFGNGVGENADNPYDTAYAAILTVTWTDEAKSVFDIVPDSGDADEDSDNETTPDDETENGEGGNSGDGDSSSDDENSSGENDDLGGGDSNSDNDDSSDDEDSDEKKETIITTTTDTIITYEYYPEATYEISIPSRLDIPSDTNGALSYQITLDSTKYFEDTDYITVTTPLDGTLTSDKHSVSFANALDTTKLTKAGDSLNGALIVNTPPASGTYTGTVTFTVNFHSNSEF